MDKKFRLRIAVVVLANLLPAIASLRAAAEPLALLVPTLTAQDIVQLMMGQSICHDAARGLELLPRCPEGERVREELQVERESANLPDKIVVRVESGFLIKGKKIDSLDKVEIYNAIASVSGLTGLTYFSETRKREAVLLDDVYRTDAPGSNHRLPDESVLRLPANSTFDIHAKDINFGPTWYRMQIDSQGPGIYLKLVNTEPQKILIVTAFDKSDLSLRYIVTQADEGIYVYSVGGATASQRVNRFVDAYSAAMKRLDAIRNWLVNKLRIW